MQKPNMLEMHKLVNGIRIKCRIAGSGSPVLLLHGSPLTSRSWDKVIPDLAQQYTVIAPDLRGHGQSDKPAKGYEISTMVEDLRQLVLALKLGTLAIVGHDLGGIVAYVFAAKYSDKVRRLGIIEAPILGVPSPTMERVLASYWHLGFYSHPKMAELLIPGREREYIEEFISTYLCQADAFTDKDFGEYAAYLASAEGLNGVLGVYRAIAAEIPSILELATRRLTMPVLAIGGERSMGIGPFEQFQHLAEDVSGGVMQESGHWVIQEQPHRLLDQLKAFLA